MRRWIDIIKLAKKGSPAPKFSKQRSEEEWKTILAPEVFRITRLHGTERPHSSDMCRAFSPGLYMCACCDTLLFDANEKYDSGTGWPSFTQAYTVDAVKYIEDNSLGMRRIETLCNSCDAHLGHVFPDGPEPSGLRYCINSLALKKDDKHKKATFGGGCFWCTHALFSSLNGISSVKSGYSGGSLKNPSYKEVCSGTTGHAEGVEVCYNPDIISLRDIFDIHLDSHDPTTLNRQGGDIGTQYRSVIFYESEEEKITAQAAIDDAQNRYQDPVITTLEPLDIFYSAEDYHQDYFENAPEQQYCKAVISPKVKKFRQKYADKIREA